MKKYILTKGNMVVEFEIWTAKGNARLLVNGKIKKQRKCESVKDLRAWYVLLLAQDWKEVKKA